MHDKNVAFRLLVIAVLTLGGIAFFPLFFVAAFVAWALFKDLTKPHQADADIWYVDRSTITADDPEWKSYFLRDCESEAERAFLNAMVESGGLLPDKGALAAQGLKVELQAQLSPYRVDFLVNDWLVVEIDGAKYHSTPEAIARDQARDSDLQGRGYAVLRIPAKTVLYARVEAIRQLRSAFAAGRPAKTTNFQPQKPKPVPSLGQTLTSIDNFVTELNFSVKKARAIQAALQQSRETFSREKMAIDSAVNIAVRRRETNAFRAQSAEHARRFDEIMAEVMAYVDDEQPITKHLLPPISAPQPHQDPIIDAEIRRSHQGLLNERSEYFQSVRNRLHGDDQLRMLVKDILEEMGYPDCWRSIAV